MSEELICCECGCKNGLVDDENKSGKMICVDCKFEKESLEGVDDEWVIKLYLLMVGYALIGEGFYLSIYLKTQYAKKERTSLLFKLWLD